MKPNLTSRWRQIKLVSKIDHQTSITPKLIGPMSRPQMEEKVSNRKLTQYPILCLRPIRNFITVGKKNSIIPKHLLKIMGKNGPLLYPLLKCAQKLLDCNFHHWSRQSDLDRDPFWKLQIKRTKMMINSRIMKESKKIWEISQLIR